MARPVKKGLYYFPLDVDFYNNYKIMDLMDKHGPLGILVYQIILSKVYSNGYYLELSLDKLVIQLVRIIGNNWIRNKDLVLQVVLYCADIGLFDKELLNQSVITSAGIQQRYCEVTVRSKADKSKYWLIGANSTQSASKAMPENRVSATETPVNATETKVNEAKIPQKKSKENQSKLNQSKLNQTKENKNSACKSQGTQSNSPCTDIILPTLNDTAYCISAMQIYQLQQHYEDIDVIKSLRRMKDYLHTHKKALRPLEAMENRVLIWLDSDTIITKKKRSAKKQAIEEYQAKKSKDSTSKSALSNTAVNSDNSDITTNTADTSYDISAFERFDIFE